MRDNEEDKDGVGGGEADALQIRRFGIYGMN